jgi:hypothetical protein
MASSPTGINEQVSDLASRVSDLESQPLQTQPSKQATPLSLHAFDAAISLATGTTSSTAWVDSGSARHLEGTGAKFAWVFAAVEDTVGGTGRTTMYGRAKGIVLPLAAISESGGSAETASGSQAFVPVQDGRFDYRLEIASGASSAGFRLELLGYFA